jgi:hypothetical protein
VVLRTFSPARAWRPAVVARLARTLGVAISTIIPSTPDPLFSLAVPALAGLFGVVVGAWLTARRDRAARQSKHLEKQL